MICVSRESSVTEPSVVMRNMRQVMNGLKNYTGQLPEKKINYFFSNLEKLKITGFKNYTGQLLDLFFPPNNFHIVTILCDWQGGQTDQ